MKRSASTVKRFDSATLSERCPHVIVDFVFENGLFLITVRNLGNEPALRVQTTFDKRFSGLDGAQRTSLLPLFRNIEFLAPNKEIRTLLDTSESYFRRRQPTKIRTTVNYRDRTNERYTETITHDLSIYKDIVYINHINPPTNERREG